jgi:hypothetical protein
VSRCLGRARRYRKYRVDTGNFAHLLHQCQDGIDIRCFHASDLTHFLNCSQQGVELKRAPAFKVLQHRGAMGANPGGAVYAPGDINAEMNAERLTDGLRFGHHGARQRACARLGN